MLSCLGAICNNLNLYLANTFKSASGFKVILDYGFGTYNMSGNNVGKSLWDEREYKTKPPFALEMIDQDMSDGTTFDWIGGAICTGTIRGLVERGYFMLDVCKADRLFLEESVISLPPKK